MEKQTEKISSQIQAPYPPCDLSLGTRNLELVSTDLSLGTCPSELAAAAIYNYAANADSDNTKKAYESDWKQFLIWTEKKNISPLPVSPENVALYLKNAAENEKLKISTIRRRLSAISEIHKRHGLKSPAHEWVVKNTLKRLRREFGAPSKAKNPLLVDDLKKMLTHIPPTLSGLRDKALLLIGFTGAFRRSELVAIKVDDITTSDAGIVVLIPESKTDQNRIGRKVAIPFGKDADTCPIHSLLAWLDAANITDGPIFRAMTKVGTVRTTPLSDRMVAEIVKKYSKLIGKKSALFSGHSLRSGFATSAAISGATESAIQKQTGHKSLLVLRRYIRDASLFRENAAAKLDL